MKKWELVRNIDQKIVQTFIQELQPVEAYINAFGDPRDFHFNVQDMSPTELDQYNLVKRQEFYPTVEQFIYAAVEKEKNNPAPMQNLVLVVQTINQIFPVVVVPPLVVPVVILENPIDPPKNP